MKTTHHLATILGQTQDNQPELAVEQELRCPLIGDPGYFLMQPPIFL